MTRTRAALLTLGVFASAVGVMIVVWAWLWVLVWLADRIGPRLAYSLGLGVPLLAPLWWVTYRGFREGAS